VSDNPRETFEVPLGDGLYFVTSDSLYMLTEHQFPALRSDRDTAVLRAFLELALARLDVPPRLTLPTTMSDEQMARWRTQHD
jgi:hypothetical protein